MNFANFWCNVSRITLGPNIPEETARAIAEALKKVSK